MTTVDTRRETWAPTVSMFGLDFDAIGLAEATSRIIDAGRSFTKGYIVTPNVDHVVMLSERPELVPLYRKAMFRFADGMPLVWLSKLLPGPALPERVTGADLLTETAKVAGQSDFRVFFLGGDVDVAEIAAATIRHYPRLARAASYYPPPGFERSAEETERIIQAVNAVRPHLLYIGVGAPKQELWAAQHLDRLDCGPILCCGIAFEFLAGIQRRAPWFVQRMGMEWAWRLLRDPRRLWKRYLVRDPKFARLAFQEWRQHR